MSIFYCLRCQNLRDSDEGCAEVGGEMVCADCEAEIEDAEEELKMQMMTEQGANK